MAHNAPAARVAAQVAAPAADLTLVAVLVLRVLIE